MKVGKQVEFHWSNYFKPTPVNIQYFIEGIKGVLGTIAVTTFVMKDEKLSFWLLVAAGVLDYLSKFFAKIANDYKEAITVEFPVSMSDEVKVTTEIKAPEGE
jgi:hypothetical protein